MISDGLRIKLKTLLGKAPSPHNTQPWELKWTSAGVEVFEDPSRRIPACDPNQHDHFVALGAFIEGLSLALSEEGLGIGNLTQVSKSPIRFKVEVKTGFEGDNLRKQILQRRSYRGKFNKATQDDKETLKSLFSPDEALVITDQKELNACAKASDRSTLKSQQNPEIQSELYQWLRLNKSHPLYNVDGLNDEALALNSIEAFGANIILKPSVFKIVDSLGISGALVTESPQIKSAAGLVCFQMKSKNEAPLDKGRRLYRNWLKLTENNFFGCPQSSLTDDQEAKALLSKLIGSDLSFLVLRVGRVNKKSLPASVRRSVVEIAGDFQ